MATNVWEIGVDALVELDGGTRAVVLAPSADGQWIPIRYVGGGFQEWLDGPSDLAHVDEIVAVVPPYHLTPPSLPPPPPPSYSGTR